MKLTTFLVACALALAACGDDEESDSAPADDPPAASASASGYCEAVKELETAGSEIFKEIEQDPNATQQDFEAAEAQLVEENADLFAELQELAPEEISAEVEILVEGIEVRAGLAEDGPSQAEQNSAEQTVNDFERENC